MNTLLAMTQDEAIVAIRQQVRDGGDGQAGAYVWMAIVALALSAILLIMRWRRGQLARPASLNDPSKLARELRRQADLSRADLRRLKRDAAHLERRTGLRVRNPMVMALCPSLNKRAA